MEEGEVFSSVGEDGFRRMVGAFYRRVPTDDVLGPMYPEHDFAGAEQRLADYLIYRFGGPTKYIEERGHPRLRARHMPFAITKAARDRWFSLMEAAMEEAAIAAEPAAVLRTFFDHMATFMINQA